MPKNSNTATDQDGEFNDWVELYNTSNSAINLEGYFLSDRRSQPTKFKFPNVIVQSEDYLSSKRTFHLENRFEKIDLPEADVLIFTLEDDSRIAIRPSGTEPKIKFYFSVNSAMGTGEKWHTVSAQLDRKIANIIKGMGL